MSIGDNANHLSGFFVNATDEKTLTNRVLSGRIVRPEMAGKVFVDDDDSLSTFTIVLGKGAASSQWYSERFEVIRRDDEDGGEGTLIERQTGLTRSLHRRAWIASHRKR